MKELKAAMEAIDKNAEDINHITKMIEEISKQTNILSLNAAIEASRAGEAGKSLIIPTVLICFIFFLISI